MGNTIIKNLEIKCKKSPERFSPWVSSKVSFSSCSMWKKLNLEFIDGKTECDLHKKNNLEVPAVDITNYYMTKTKMKIYNASFSPYCLFQWMKQVLILIISAKRASTLLIMSHIPAYFSNKQESKTFLSPIYFHTNLQTHYFDPVFPLSPPTLFPWALCSQCGYEGTLHLLTAWIESPGYFFSHILCIWGRGEDDEGKEMC